MTRRGPIVAGLMLSTALAAMDGTIVATAVPAIVRDLGSFSLFPWVLAAYMLAQAVFTPIYGRLADVYGRKPVLLAGASIFLAGSLLAGVAWSMPALIVARAVQGVGAGAIQPITQTIAGDLYPLARRGRISALLSTVWGVSALLGPALGGLLSEFGLWRWIFLLNLPVGIAALVMITVFLRESVERRPGRLDLLGGALLCAGVVAVMTGLQSSDWRAVLAGLALLAAFLRWERHVPEPVIPPWIWRDRALLGSFLGSAAVGMVLIAPTLYLPVYAQTVLGAGAVAAGAVLAVQSIGWPLAAAGAHRLYMRYGFRDTALAGLALIVVSTVMFALLTPASPLVYAGACAFVNGAGLGLVSVSCLVGAQSMVGWERRGAVTGGVVFFRIAGGAIGTAVFAAVANASLLSSGAVASVDEVGGALDLAAGEAVRAALAAAVHHVFLTMIVVAVLGVLAVLVMPSRRETAEGGGEAGDVVPAD
ncbi:MFS transporter [Streptosporangium roseum]|uniref:Multidrug transport protein n=1 Tax=Streptosporangium roseum (strain ATCC 12428 / DSM 43021 / JCM 3005 / KCTC 9067 / NCIMB 10171 / NRRL 2505 / NI 9100) TaxID=479432 RepID=D2BFU4_STRRD|nr:MFS transporter [Streptosporangium roseum]ACZ90255.1 putative multidrug transport protein [Streptosporangium roseum DSM 43021]